MLESHSKQSTQQLRGGHGISHPPRQTSLIDSSGGSTLPGVELKRACRYLGDGVHGAALGVAIADAHAAHRDVFDCVVILQKRERETDRTKQENQ